MFPYGWRLFANPATLPPPVIRSLRLAIAGARLYTLTVRRGSCRSWLAGKANCSRSWLALCSSNLPPPACGRQYRCRCRTISRSGPPRREPATARAMNQRQRCHWPSQKRYSTLVRAPGFNGFGPRLARSADIVGMQYRFPGLTGVCESWLWPMNSYHRSLK